MFTPALAERTAARFVPCVVEPERRVSFIAFRQLPGEFGRRFGHARIVEAGPPAADVEGGVGDRVERLVVETDPGAAEFGENPVGRVFELRLEDDPQPVPGGEVEQPVEVVPDEFAAPPLMAPPLRAELHVGVAGPGDLGEVALPFLARRSRCAVVLAAVGKEVEGFGFHKMDSPEVDDTGLCRDRRRFPAVSVKLREKTGSPVDFFILCVMVKSCIIKDT